MAQRAGQRVPKMRVATAFGQRRERELDDLLATLNATVAEMEEDYVKALKNDPLPPYLPVHGNCLAASKR